MIDVNLIQSVISEVGDLRVRVEALEAQIQAQSQIPQIHPQPTESVPPDSASPPASPPASGWRPVLHKPEATPPGCGQPAFYLIRLFRRDETADLAAMRVCTDEPGADPNRRVWRPPGPNDVPACSSCGLGISPFATRDLDWSQALVPETPAQAQTPLAQADPLDPSFDRHIRYLRERLKPDPTDSDAHG
jgi:hypothetical protein